MEGNGHPGATTDRGGLVVSWTTAGERTADVQASDHDGGAGDGDLGLSHRAGSEQGGDELDQAQVASRIGGRRCGGR